MSDTRLVNINEAPSYMNAGAKIFHTIRCLRSRAAEHNEQKLYKYISIRSTTRLGRGKERM